MAHVPCTSLKLILDFSDILRSWYQYITRHIIYNTSPIRPRIVSIKNLTFTDDKTHSILPRGKGQNNLSGSLFMCCLVILFVKKLVSKSIPLPQNLTKHDPLIPHDRKTTIFFFTVYPWSLLQKEDIRNRSLQSKLMNNRMNRSLNTISIT